MNTRHLLARLDKLEEAVFGASTKRRVVIFQRRGRKTDARPIERGAGEDADEPEATDELEELRRRNAELEAKLAAKPRARSRRKTGETTTNKRKAAK